MDTEKYTLIHCHRASVRYLDTLSSSKRAVHLYEKAGFEQTERYNDNYTADIFMVLNLDK